MSETYLAALVYGPGDVRLEQVRREVPGPNDVLIDVRAATICPSDLREYRGVKPAHHPLRVGHELAGYVAEVGAAVTRVKPGDRVTALSWTPCMQCYQCRRGSFSACENRTINMGGFAEYMLVREWTVFKVPDRCSFEKASCTEPLASILKANTEVTPVHGGDQVVVYGLGPMGVLHAQVARMLGARVIGIDLIPMRRELALRVGCHDVIDPNAGDVVEQVKALTGGRGANVTMVTVGGSAEPACTETAVNFAAHGGKINIFAGTYPVTPMSIDPNLVHYGELTITGTRSYNLRTFQMALELISDNRIDVLSVRFPDVTLNEIQRGFEIHGTADAMKVAVLFGKG